jgi:hypothetical protein
MRNVRSAGTAVERSAYPSDEEDHRSAAFSYFNKVRFSAGNARQ